MALRVLIDGLGLMGGSLAAILSSQGADVYCHHRRPEVAREAEAKGWGTAIESLDPKLTIDVAVTCVPVDVVAERVRAIHDAYPGALITDVGSTKVGISDQLQDLLRSNHFIGSHPMCGSHSQGLAHARIDLYQGATVVLCPCSQSTDEKIALLTTLWQQSGGKIVIKTPQEHDSMVARVSHMPHILAAVAARRLNDEALPLAATGFRDTTRVAAGSPSLWTSILQENQMMVLEEIQQCIADLECLKDALLDSSNEADSAVEAWLQGGQDARHKFEAARQQSSSGAPSTP